MKEKLAAAVVTAVFAALAVLGLKFWLQEASGVPIERRLPGMDGTTGRDVPAEADRVDIKGKFKAALPLPSGPVAIGPSAPWPNFRGPAFDNICSERVPLAESWPAAGPPVLWSLDLGEGHAGPAVLNGRVYVLDYDEKARADSLRCLSLQDGREIWRRWYFVSVKRNHGMSRTVPAVTDKYVVTIGPRCHTMCVDATTGDFKWGIDMVRDWGTEEPLWYTGQCPLIDGNVAVLAPGGKALLIGVDCETGKIVWQTPNPAGWKMSHASIVPMTFAEKKVYLYSAIGGMAAVSAESGETGRIVWQTTEWNNAVQAPSPVPLNDGRIFVTAGYGRGSMMLQVSESGGQFTVKPLYRLERTVFACEQQSPIFYRGVLFGILPKDAEALKSQLACLHPDGKLAWTSGKTDRFGLGPFLIADDKIFVLNDDGVLTLAKAGTDGYVRLAQAKILDGRDAWGPLALVGGRLILRDFKRMLCIDVAKK